MRVKFVPVVQPIPTNPRFVDLRGRRYGMLTVEEYVGISKKAAHWRCRCDCGRTSHPTSQSLTDGRSRSCGCQQKIATSRAKRQHGHTSNDIDRRYTPEYTCWLRMKSRCYNEKDKSYKRYGARGITVCDRWLHGEDSKSGFECFFEDMGYKPTDSHSIDRKDNDLGYSKGNCRWAVQSVQQRNRRDTIRVQVGTWEMDLASACEYLGLKYNLVRDRMQRGWNWDRASTEPVHWRGQR